LITFLEQDVGAELISDLIERTTVDINLYLSLINLGEIAYITERERGTEQAKQLLNDIQQLPLSLCQVSEERVLAAAHYKKHTTQSCTQMQ
jgi:hypothetical protein